jgi:hypothetical protein
MLGVYTLKTPIKVAIKQLPTLFAVRDDIQSQS